MNDALRDAYAVLFPAIGALELDSNLQRYLERGGVCLLLGESREEFDCQRNQERPP